MSLYPHHATERETERLWPLVRAARLMESPEELAAYREAGPWRVRVTERGDAAVLGVWRQHLDVLAMRGVWGSERAVGALVDDAVGLARAQGLGRVLSPLVTRWALAPYLGAGMHEFESIVALQANSAAVSEATVPTGVVLRRGRPADFSALVRLDARCFDEFWRYGEPEFTELVRNERLVVAEDDEGVLLGYTLATASRGAATLSRLAVEPDARQRGLGAALLSDAARWAERAGAATFSLCTQEHNTASRSVYARAGLHEVEDRYAFAIREASTGELRS